jgi:segregation and condensation protein B
MQEVEQTPDAEVAAPDMTHQDETHPTNSPADEVGAAAGNSEVEGSQPATEDADGEEFFEVSDIVAEVVSDSVPGKEAHDRLKAVIEAAIYITDEPLSTEQIAAAVEQPIELVQSILQLLVEEYAAPSRGLAIRELAGGYKLSTKPEHHEDIRKFVKRLQAPLKLSLAALETLAVIAYKQPITGPEVLDIRGVQGAGVLKTLLDRKLIATAGRKNVLGKPMMYKTTREFLVQFGLNSLAELPTLKEFEELGRLALSDGEGETPGSRDASRGTTQTAAGGTAGPEAGEFDFESILEDQEPDALPLDKKNDASAEPEDAAVQVDESDATVKGTNG